MEMDSSFVGLAFSGPDFEVTWRKTMNYAAATGDNNPRYFDDTRKGGVMAPPMFAVAVTWLAIDNANPENRVRRSLSPEIAKTSVHATEHLIFHRPIRPGDRLKVRGEFVAVRPTSAGVHSITRLNVTNENGEAVFTEYNGTMFRTVRCKDSGQGMDKIPVSPGWDPSEKPIWDVELPVAPEMAHLYDGCTDIVFPIHTSRAFALDVGLPDIILQGTCTLALAARELLNREADSDPERMKELACRFTRPVIPGTRIRVQLTHKERTEKGVYLGFRVLNAKHEIALSTGFVRIALPCLRPNL
jgi:acyl dehydratase